MSAFLPSSTFLPPPVFPTSRPRPHQRCLPTARNTFILVRHAESVPNLAQKIVSRPSVGVLPENGLTPSGHASALAAGSALAPLVAAKSTLFLTSDFSRAAETAAHLRSSLPSACLRVEPRLRERFFGTLDGGPSAAYETVWAEDLVGGDRPSGTESVYAVAGRAAQVVRECDALLDETAVVLVAHGDVLQILAAVFEGRDAARHREGDHLENCGMRVYDGGVGRAHVERRRNMAGLEV